MTEWHDLTQLLEAAPGDYGVCVWNGLGEQRYGYREQSLRSAASLIKVPLAMTIYDRYRDELDTLLTLGEGDRVEGQGTLDHAPPGTTRSIRGLIRHALSESDNTAANLLIKQIGFAAVNDWLRELGLETRLQRMFMDLDALRAGRDNLTSAGDMCALFYRMLRPEYAELVTILRGAVGDGKLEAGLPAGTVLAHKVGNLDEPIVEHDAGIVLGPCEPYVVAVLALRPPTVAGGRQTIAGISRLIWRKMTGAAAGAFPA